MAGGIFFRSFRIIPDICRIIPDISGRSVCRTWHFSRYGQCAKTASPAPAAQTAHRPSPFQNPQCCIYHFSDILSKTRCGAAWLRTAFQTAKNLVEFAPAGANKMSIRFVQGRKQRTNYARRRGQPFQTRTKPPRFAFENMSKDFLTCSSAVRSCMAPHRALDAFQNYDSHMMERVCSSRYWRV